MFASNTISPRTIGVLGRPWMRCLDSSIVQGARTYGKTKEGALRNIQEAVQMIVDGSIEEGKPVAPDIELESPAVVVTV